MNSVNHILEGYKNFYNEDIGITNVTFDIDILDSIKRVFNQNPIINHTLYMLFYAGEECSTGANFKNFLYQLHARYSGMHAFTLFIDCAEVYRVS